MAREAAPAARIRPAITLLTLAVVLAGLYVAREVLIPLSLAILLSFILAPLVIRLQRMGLSRVSAVIIVVTLSFAVIGALLWVVTIQLIDLASQLPQYRTNVREKVDALLATPSGPLGRAAENVKEVIDELAAPSSQVQSPTAPPVPNQPEAAAPNVVPVEIQERPPNPLEYLTATVGGLISPLATAGIVIVFVIFILVQREGLRDRLLRLAGRTQLTTSTQALNEAAERVSTYLTMQLTVNATYGIAVGIGLWFIGVPNAILWGLLAIVLRFIPYVGPILAAAMPITLSFAVFEAWARPLTVVGLFIVIELISNNIIEPWLYGTKTGITAMALLVSAVFWTWLWGPIGLMLATPLTVCLVVIGRHVPQLEFLHILLGDEPALTSAERIYQRLLARDLDEAAEHADDLLEQSSLLEVYDNALLPALGLAERDAGAGEIDAGLQQFIRRSIRDIVEDLHDKSHEAALKDEEPAAESVAAVAAAVAATVAAKVAAGGRSVAEAAGVMSAEPKAESDDAVETVAAKHVVAAAAVEAPATAPELTKHDHDSTPLAGLRVLCLPAMDEADEIAGVMLNDLLEASGASAQTLRAETTIDDVVQAFNSGEADALCISALPPYAATHSRYATKRLRSRLPNAKIVVGLWHIRGDAEKLRSRVHAAGATAVVTTLAEALQSFAELSEQTTASAQHQVHAGRDEPARAMTPESAGSIDERRSEQQERAFSNPKHGT